MTRARMRCRQDVVTYATVPPVGRGGPAEAHTGRVAEALHQLTGLSVAHCQTLLSEGREIRMAGRIIEAHVTAQDLGTTFVQRIAPIELAMARIGAEQYCGALEMAEQEADGAEDVDQTRYQLEPSAENGRRRIRSNNREIARLYMINRAIAARHGFRL